MRPRCPWCEEPLESGESRPESCPRCGRPQLGSDGRELRRIDVRYERVEREQRQRYREVMISGGVAAAALFLFMPLLHFTVTPATVVPLALVTHMIALRLFLIRRARRLLGPARRISVRWLSRLTFLWVGAFGYGMTVVPVAGVLFGVGTYAGLTTFVHHYTLWSLSREVRRQPLARWEKMALGGVTLLTLVAIGVAVALALAVGWSVAWLLELFSGG